MERLTSIANVSVKQPLDFFLRAREWLWIAFCICSQVGASSDQLTLSLDGLFFPALLVPMESPWSGESNPTVSFHFPDLLQLFPWLAHWSE